MTVKIVGADRTPRVESNRLPILAAEIKDALAIRVHSPVHGPGMLPFVFAFISARQERSTRRHSPMECEPSWCVGGGFSIIL
jgi:hypothetical protein